MERESEESLFPRDIELEERVKKHQERGAYLKGERGNTSQGNIHS